MTTPVEGPDAWRVVRERGATAVEYSLMMAMIALVIIAATRAFGESVNDLFELARDQFP